MSGMAANGTRMKVCAVGKGTVLLCLLSVGGEGIGEGVRGGRGMCLRRMIDVCGCD